MAQALYDNTIEYEDGTPASASQLAKDVCTFLKWTAEPEHDERKRLWIKVYHYHPSFPLVSTLNPIIYLYLSLRREFNF